MKEDIEEAAGNGEDGVAGSGAAAGDGSLAGGPVGDGVAQRRMRRRDGWLALSPLLVFLGVYLVTSLVAHDFYSVPVASAFLIASCYAIVITKGHSVDDKIAIFSRGAGDRNVLLMIWIFVLAGAFASTAKDIGAINATVNLTLRLLPGNLIFAGIFVAACFISMAIGTSVGTIAAIVPVTTELAAQAGLSPAFMAAIVVGGAFFGDNLSFISDTTIAATRTQGCQMRDKFRVNLYLTIPAAVIVALIYVFYGQGVEAPEVVGKLEPLKLTPYILIIILAASGVNVTVTLAIGIVLNAVLGLLGGSLTWAGWLQSMGSGIAGMGDLIIVTMLAGGMLEVIRHNGGIDFIISGLTRRIRGKRGAELSIAALVSFANLCTANNTIAIITTGGIARDIVRKYGLDARKSASILDTFSCGVQGLIPYGAQMLMASGLAAVAATDIIRWLFYPVTLMLVALLAIVFRLPRKYS